MAVAGRVLMIPAGIWVSGSKYEMLDVVVHAGSSYVAKKNIINSAKTPPSDAANWQLLAQGYDVTSLVTKDKIVNNFLATDPTMVLGAPMGKQLKDEIDKQSSDLTDKMTLKVTSYTHAYLNGPISVKRMVNSIIIDINTTTAQYLNKSIDHTVATLTGDFAPINSLALVPVNGTGVLSYVKISNTGALTLNLTTALAAGSELCIHVEFIAK